MKYREPSHKITPVHNLHGYSAPSIHVDADSHAEAVKIAKDRSTLIKRFPDKWTLR